jgi:hypothetical protein
MDSPNHYEVLSISPDATADEIRTAYRRLIRVYHPDVASASGEAMTLRLNDAQHELLDPARRAAYDRRMGLRDERSRYGVPDGNASSFKPWHFSSAEPPLPAPGPRNLTRYLAWMTAMILSIGVLVTATAVIFGFSYAGPLTLGSPRFVPAIVVGVAWLAAGLIRPPKILFGLVGVGAILWPLTALHFAVFAPLDALPLTVLAAMTIASLSVAAIRWTAPRANAQSRGRPPRRGIRFRESSAS